VVNVDSGAVFAADQQDCHPSNLCSRGRDPVASSDRTRRWWALFQRAISWRQLTDLLRLAACGVRIAEIQRPTSAVGAVGARGPDG
jgi:hypothetical protein